MNFFFKSLNFLQSKASEKGVLLHTSGLYLVGNGDKALPEVLNPKGLYMVLFRSVKQCAPLFFH